MSRVYVWDSFVRLFHWTLVLCIFSNFFYTTDGDLTHEVLGYIAAGFVVLRFLWGFVGTSSAQFKNWLRGPKATFDYIRNYKNRPHTKYHNPLAAWMMVFLMACVIALGISGFMMGTDAFFGEEWVEELHENIANVMMGAVAIHVLGVLLESYKEKQNLVASMFHGYKRDDF